MNFALKQYTADVRADMAEKFLNALFGNVTGEHYGYLWTKQGKATYPYRVSDAAVRKQMARRAIELSDKGNDVYVGVNVGNEPAALDKRYTREQITVQTAVVADIDVEGGNHSSDADKIYPPNFAVAKSFLPFDVSLLVDSGYGLHGYCLFAEPVATICDENRCDCENRNRRFIDTVRRRAGVFGKAVDGVGDLPRVLRMPGTRNYKAGVSNDAPICKLVATNDIRFTPADIDERLAALKPAPVSKQQDVKPTSPRRDYQSTGDMPTEQERALAMLAVIPCAKQTYEDWYQTGMILKNNGNNLADWEIWSRDDKRFKDGECEKKWQGFTRGGLTIATLHRLAKFYGYSEKDFQREWHAINGGGKAMRQRDSIPPACGEENNGRDELIEPLFHGDASDRDFAKRLEYLCGERVKWCDEAKRWYIYSGGVWKKNSGENSAVSPFADDLADTLEQHAATDGEHKLAASFKSAKKIGSAISLLKARHSVRITLDDLDTHRELLNVKNGVVDLQTGKLYPADPTLLLTKQAGAAYEPTAQSPLVEEFFKAIQPDETTMCGLLRWLSYCLTSETREHKFAVLTGERGANGKSTLSGVMLKLAGGYGTGLGTRALLKNQRPTDANAATTSINALEGVRFALAEEMPLDAELDSSLIKNLSGGDDINIRLNYGEFRTVPNFAKINISGNYLPRIENINDGGIQRRLLNFAFNVRFGVDRPADPLLKEKLCSPENLNALLAILVREAALWYRDGLIISDAMKAETQRVLDASNFVADFIADFYVKAPKANVKAKDFIDELKREYPRETARFKKRADLIQLIAAQDGVAYSKDNHNGNVFKGIGKLERDSKRARDSDFGSEPIGKNVATPY